MNPEITFALHVASQNSGEVWPHGIAPQLEERIKENYYVDDDEAMTTFRVTDMDDLLMLIDFYRTKLVRLVLTAEVKTPELCTTASLVPSHQGRKHGTVRLMEEGPMSTMTAALKLQAIARALVTPEKPTAKPKQP